MNEKLLTPEQAAGRLGVAARTLAQWRADGTGPDFVRHGPRLIRYRPADLDRWIDDRLQTADGGVS